MTTPTDKELDAARKAVRKLVVQCLIAVASLYERLAELEARK